MEYYIVEGPADAGNQCGYFKRGFVPAGKFIIARSVEYTNGGYGPITVDGVAYSTRERALAALERLTGAEAPGSTR